MPSLETSANHADELATQFINGNRERVVNECLRDGLLAVRVYEHLENAGDPSWTRGIYIRLLERAAEKEN